MYKITDSLMYVFPTVPPINLNQSQYNQPNINKKKQTNKNQKYNPNNIFHKYVNLFLFVKIVKQIQPKI